MCGLPVLDSEEVEKLYEKVKELELTVTVKELRQKSGMTLKQFAEYFEISQRTVESWESDSASGRKCPDYLLKLMQYKLIKESIIK